MKCIVYSCITGDWDYLKRLDTTCQRILVCDKEPQFEEGALRQWDRVPLAVAVVDNRMASRFPKCMPHLFFETDVSIWVDSHLRWKRDPVCLLDYLGDNDIALFRHSLRDCLYEEATAVVTFKEINRNAARRQMGHYLGRGYPKHNGLFANGVIVRRHTERMKQLGLRWWAELCRWQTGRDQLSFCYVCWKMGIRCSTIPGNILNSDFTEKSKHLAGRRM